MAYLGDYAEDYADLNFKFTTRQPSGAPITFAGTPAVSVYKSNDVNETVTGVTLTVDFDSVTGLHNVNIDLSAAAFYAINEDYQVVVTAGTVNGVSVVGEVLAEFSIENRFTDVQKWLGADPNSILATEADIADAVWDEAIAGHAAGGSTGEALIDTGGAATVADVNAQVLDVLNVDTFTEPGQGAPTATPTIREMLHYIYKFWRNKKDNDGTQTTLYDNAGTTADQVQPTSDSAGTTTFDEWTTGA